MAGDRRRLSTLLLSVLLAAGLMASRRVDAQTVTPPVEPNPLRAVLPRASDLPGFQQAVDGPIGLAALQTGTVPTGVVRGFGGEGDTALAFELFPVSGEDVARVRPSAAGEALLRPDQESGPRTVHFRLTGPLGVGDDDLSAAWDAYDPALEQWDAVYADVFLSGPVLGMVLYAAPLESADPSAPGMYARLLEQRVTAPDLPPGPSDWTFQGVQTVLVQDGPHGGGGEHLTTVRIWFAPGVGWRAEFMAAGPERRRVFGSDGTTYWDYDAVTNRYTLAPASPAYGDPRWSFLGGEFGLPGTNDLASALAAARRIPGNMVTLEGTEMVAGRLTRRVHVSPAVCEASEHAGSAPSGTTRSGPSTTCYGSTECWMDVETGWVLRSIGDGSGGRRYTVDTVSVTIDGPIDSALFQFTPPPGSTGNLRSVGAERGPVSGARAQPDTGLTAAGPRVP